MRDIKVAVPDLAGWRRQRMPYLPEGHRIKAVLDWACEILSPSTASRDREIKIPLYAYYGVQYAWLIDLVKHTLEVYRLDVDSWMENGCFADVGPVVTPPFEAVSLDLGAF